MSLRLDRRSVLCAAGALLASPARAQEIREVTIGLGSGSLVAATARVAAEIGLFRDHRLQPKFNGDGQRQRRDYCADLAVCPGRSGRAS